MNDLGTASITSMEVAEMTGKIHKILSEVLKHI